MLHETAIHVPPEVSAREAGLRYAMDDRPGIARKAKGKGFAYFDPQGREVRDPQVLGPDQAAGDPAGVDGGVDRAAGEWAFAGDRARMRAGASSTAIIRTGARCATRTSTSG